MTCTVLTNSHTEQSQKKLGANTKYEVWFLIFGSILKSKSWLLREPIINNGLNQTAFTLSSSKATKC